MAGFRCSKVPRTMEDTAYAEMYAQEDVHWWFRGRRAVIWSLLTHVTLPSPARVLDAGCGTGRNLAEFGRLGSIAGIDPSASAVAFCHERGFDAVEQAGIESLPFADDSFDLIFALDVLEHVEDDLGALRELRRAGDAGSVLLLTVPAYQWMWTEHDVQLHHVRRYTLRALRRQVIAGGFEPITWSYFNTFALPLVAAARLTERFSDRSGQTDLDRTPAMLNRVLERPLHLEARLIERGVSLPAGVSIGMVCRNPG